MIINRIWAAFLAFLISLPLNLIANKGPLFKPFIGNIYESRLGAIFTDNEEKLRLDIGGNYDIYTNATNPQFLWSIGGEFFTYTRLRNEGKFKFPVETTDFYFGLNVSAKIEFDNLPVESRLRIAHISTHLSDGYSNDGVFYQTPFVYSREFLDLAIAARFGDFRPYFGSIFVFSYIPKDVNLVIPQVGCELRTQIFGNFDFAIAYDLKNNGYESPKTQNTVYKAMNMIVGGIIFRTDDNRGIFFRLERYFGGNYYGQFYKECDNYFGFGFELIYH